MSNDSLRENHDTLVKYLKKALYYGYLYDKAGLRSQAGSDEDYYQITQAAVYQVTHYGNHSRSELPMGGATFVGSTGGAVLDKLLDIIWDDSYATPAGELYLYWCNVGVSQNDRSVMGQHLIGGELGEPVEISTQANTSKSDATRAADGAVELTIPEGETTTGLGTVWDVIT